MRDHGSIGLPLGMGSFGGFFRLLVCFGFSFLVLFCAGRTKVLIKHMSVLNVNDTSYYIFFAFYSRLPIVSLPSNNIYVVLVHVGFEE